MIPAPRRGFGYENKQTDFVYLLDLEELPASQGGRSDNTDDNVYSEDWIESDHQDDPTYTPEMNEDSLQSSESAGSDWSSEKPSVSDLQS